jgi:Uri superfamily endonuclease
MEGIIIGRLNKGQGINNWSYWHLAGGAEILWLLIDGNQSESEISLELSKRFTKIDHVSETKRLIDIFIEDGLLEPPFISE